MTTITTNGSEILLGSRLPNSAFVDMPDFSDTIKKQAQEAGQLYTGNKIYNGSSIDVNQPIYVNGSSAVFDGILYVPNGNITMNGSSQTVNGRVIGNTVTINGSNLNIISGTNELKPSFQFS